MGDTEAGRDPVLRVEQVAVAAAGRTLLAGVQLELRRGERIALTGRSGIGKTTLLRVLASLAEPASGRVLLEGRTPAEVGWTRYRRRVVLVEQRPVMLPGTVRDNLARPFSYRTAAEPYPEGRAEELLLRLRLDPPPLRQEARSLSVGEQQRVSLVRALLVAPDVLLLDEPTSALDEDARDAVADLLREEARTRGLAAIVATHHAEGRRGEFTRRVDLDAAARTGAGAGA